jgi:response regulator of citrate/malate metabolism
MKKILVIEDNHGQQEVYKYWFSNHSLVERAVALPHLDFCEKISDAWRLLETKDYDFILLDLYLGAEESGASFLEGLIIKPKVIVVSAYLSFLKESVMKEKENVVWLDKEEATQERLIFEMGLKEDG